MARNYDFNTGVLELKDVPDDRYVAGAAIVLVDEYGNYSTHFIAEDRPNLPTSEVQETIGGFLATAYDIANLVTSN